MSERTRITSRYFIISFTKEVSGKQQSELFLQAFAKRKINHKERKAIPRGTKRRARALRLHEDVCFNNEKITVNSVLRSWVLRIEKL
jgi:hypothetical protein